MHYTMREQEIWVSYCTGSQFIISVHLVKETWHHGNHFCILDGRFLKVKENNQSYIYI